MKIFDKISLCWREYFWELKYNGSSVKVTEDMWTHDGVYHNPPWIEIPRTKHLQGRYPRVRYYEAFEDGAIRERVCKHDYDKKGNLKIHRASFPGIGMPFDYVKLRITR